MPRDDRDREEEAERGLIRRRPGGALSDSRRDVQVGSALGSLVPGWNGAERDTPDRVITAVRRLPPASARCGPFPPGVDPRLRAALAERGVAELYSHQAEAIASVLAGRHVVITTPTAS